MNRQEALETLGGGTSGERLTAARSLQELAALDDIPVLRNRLSQEPDAWVRRALVRALRRLGALPAAPDELAEDSPALHAVVDEAWAEAAEEVASLILHEISPLAGSIAQSARRELDNYESSKTGAAIGRLQELLGSIGRLRRAASPPTLGEFDMTDLVARAISEESLEDDARVRPARDQPVVTLGDEHLVRLAFCNGLRNAVDAIDASPDPTNGEVVINWGMTEAWSWITILDTGVGLPAGADRIFEFGVTSKSRASHFGFGLPIAHRALTSLGGEIHLRPREGGGTAFDMRWPLTGPQRD